MAEIKWQDWNTGTFEKAKKEDKPVLLDLTASWCHWCHIMDSTSYSNNKIISIINSRFIPVRVDIDKRPDIKDRYNFGGFPTTAFLTPDGDLISGNTYVPPEDLEKMLIEIEETYRQRKEEIRERLLEFKKLEPEKKERGKVNFEVIEEIIGYLSYGYDAEYGGFGTRPKFPHSEGIELLMLWYFKTGNEKYLRMVENTLGKMASSGIYDSEEGGFFRYSVTQDWGTPHYEKMLEGNARLLSNYIDAFKLTGKKIYREIAEGVLGYIEAYLKNEKGGFYGSQTANEEYYCLLLEEREEKEKPAVDKTVYLDWNGIAISAYVKAYGIFSERYGDFALKSADYLWEACSTGKELLHYPGGTAGNLADYVLFGNALLDCYQYSADTKYLSRAKEAASFVLDNFRDEKGGFFDIVVQPDAVGKLKERAGGFEINSQAILFFSKLYYMSGEEIYRENARYTAEVLRGSVPDHEYLASGYGLGLASLFWTAKLTLIGSPDDGSMKDAIRKLQEVYRPAKLIQPLDHERDKELILKLGYEPSGNMIVYTCIGSNCFEPTEDIEKVLTILKGSK